MTPAPRPLEGHEMIGVVRNRGATFVIVGTAADFILDYPSYDPGYDPEAWEYEFRGGLLVVEPTMGFRYLAARRTSTSRWAATPAPGGGPRSMTR